MQARVMTSEMRVGVSVWGSTVGSGSALYWAVSGNVFHGRNSGHHRGLENRVLLG